MYRTKNKFWLAFLMTTVLSLSSCELLQETARQYYPDVNLKSVDLASLDFEGVNLKFNYNIHNKAAFPINLNKLAFKIFVDGKQLIATHDNKKISIPAHGDSTLEFVHRFKYLETFESLSALFKKDKVKIKLDGVTGFLLTEALGAIDVPIKAEKEITVPKIPQIKVLDFYFQGLNTQNILNPKATFNLKFSINNPNIFPLDISRIAYQFNVKNSQLFTGITNKIKVNKNQTSELNLPITLQGGELMKLLPALKNFQSLDYKFLSDIYFKVAGQELKIPLAYPK